MTNVLILGGTGWLSGRIAAKWVASGARVSCLGRGSRPAPAGAALVQGDRDNARVYDSLARQEWDEVVDVTSVAWHAEQAVAALGESTAHWSYVSSVSVYADDVKVSADESAPLHLPAHVGDEYEYGPQKSASERAVSTLGERASVIRPGLIVGAGDTSDRFGYWAAAFERAGTEPVLVPPREGRKAQVIDVEDLADYVVAMNANGPVNAVGNVFDLGDVLDRVRAVSGHTGEVISGTDEWLTEQGVSHWAGEHSLPLWLPPDVPGFMTRSNARYLASGGVVSALDDTIVRVREDERARGIDRERRAGLTRADEQRLLQTLR